MKERPILFSAPMVRAILDGRKTQTRRVVTPQPFIDAMNNFCWNGGNYGQSLDGKPHVHKLWDWKHKGGRIGFCPYGQIGDHLWVRESILQTNSGMTLPSGEYESYWTREKVEYLADEPTPQRRYLRPDHYGSPYMQTRPSIHMPRWACRIELEIIDIRVERLQDINTADVLAEGCPLDPYYRDTTQDGSNPHMVKTGVAQWQSPRAWYHELWDVLNAHLPPAKRAPWDSNPWVWVVEFKRVTA